MSLFAKALRCLYQDKDAVYLWPEGFAACAAVCAESRASLRASTSSPRNSATTSRRCTVTSGSCRRPRRSYSRVRRHRKHSSALDSR